MYCQTPNPGETLRLTFCGQKNRNNTQPKCSTISMLFFNCLDCSNSVASSCVLCVTSYNVYLVIGKPRRWATCQQVIQHYVTAITINISSLGERLPTWKNLHLLFFQLSPNITMQILGTPLLFPTEKI